MAKVEEQYITQISSNITIKGDIIGESNVRVAGKVIGTIDISGDLIVEKTGLIEGEIKSGNTTIAGRINGNIECLEKLTLESTSKFVGNIKTKQLIIENGSFFQGACEMQTNENKQAVPPKKLNL